MLAQSLRAARPMVARIARTQARRTLFTPTSVRSADIVQNLYLSELGKFKPTPVSAKDAEGQVQTFSVPKAPKSPEEADLANDLKTYETQSVDVEGSAEGGEGAEAVSDEWFEEEEEAAPAAAH